MITCVDTPVASEQGKRNGTIDSSGLCRDVGVGALLGAVGNACGCGSAVSSSRFGATGCQEKEEQAKEEQAKEVVSAAKGIPSVKCKAH